MSILSKKEKKPKLDGDAQGANKSETPEKDATVKSVQELDREEAKAQALRNPAPTEREDESEQDAKVGDQVLFVVDDPTSVDGVRKLAAIVADVLKDDHVNLCVFNQFGSNYGQVAIEFSPEAKVGRWSWPEDVK